MYNNIQWWSLQTEVRVNHPKEKLSRPNIKLKEKLSNIRRKWENKCVSLGKRTLNLKVYHKYNLGSDKTNTLPNSFPFKAQILQHFKNQQPVETSSTTETLVPAEWGLIAL